MRRSLRWIPILPIFLTAGFAEQATVSLHSGLPVPGLLKVDQGYVIQFDRLQKDPRREAIEVFDRAGSRILAVDLRGQLPEAAEVTVYDVSLGTEGPLAVGAVIRRTNGSLRRRRCASSGLMARTSCS